jgi:hypothetical protein
MPQIPFEITATPTGFEDGEVVVEGRFLYEFDAGNEKLLSHSATVDSLSRKQFLAQTDVLYEFSTQILDTSTQGEFESSIGTSRGLRDTVEIEVRLLVAFDDGSGTVTNVLDSRNIREAGNRYFVPPLT